MADMANRNEVKVLLKTALLRTLNDNFNGLKSEIDIANFTDDMVTSNMDMDRETLSLTGLDGDEILYNDPLTKKKLFFSYNYLFSNQETKNNNKKLRN